MAAPTPAEPVTCAMGRRCHHWQVLGAAELAVIAAGGVLQHRAFRENSCHPALSRVTRALLGRHGVWVFPIAGFAFTWHLLNLD